MPVGLDQLRTQYEWHAELIDFFHGLESGMITLTLSDYTSLPSALPPAWRIYKNTMQDLRKKKRS